jgi:flagellar biosynthesis chaperone FliJ
VASSAASIEKALWKRRAIQETLAEVATYQERSSQGEWDEGVPSKSWQQFETQVRQIYPTIKSKAGP